MLDGRFRLDNYVVGAANRLAASAARAIAETPGAVYNPLFIYSGSGLGKTHLLAALGHAIRQLHPDLAVAYLTVDDFVEQLHAAIGNGQAAAFKRRYLNVDVLLLDDVQFLTGKVETQSEMLRILNTLQGNGRQIVMTSDRPPADIADVDARLLSRLSGGLIVDIGVPDYETRVAILRHKCGEQGVTVGAGVLEELARLPSANVRELQGALTRLVAHQSLLNAPLTVADVWHIVGNARVAEPASPDEFEIFVNDLALTVARSVEQWRVRLGEAIARWSGEGFHTAMLERLLEETGVPDVDAADAAFGAAAERLRSLEGEAIRLDPASTGLPVFRDPERESEAEAWVARLVALSEPPPGPRAGYRLQDLTMSSGNQLALQAAADVVESPATKYNPLFVYGAPGTGRTHLAHAIGNALRARDRASWIVACVTSRVYVDELIAALETGSVERWRARYRAVDALIVDDVQDLEGKERTQEELFHLFNILQQSGRQIVLTSNRPLAGLVGLAQRLRSRFEGGLVVEMGPSRGCDRLGRNTPVPPGDEAAAPNIDVMLHEALAPPPDAPSIDFAILSQDRQALDSFFFDAEKVVADWPGADGRVIEELR